MNARDRKLLDRLAAAWPDATIEFHGRGRDAKIRIAWPDCYTWVGARSLAHIREWSSGLFSWEGHERRRRPWNDASLAAYIEAVNQGLAARRAAGGAE